MACGKKERRVARLTAAVARYAETLARLHSQAPTRPTAATPAYVRTVVGGMALQTLHPDWRAYYDACEAYTKTVEPIARVLALERHALNELLKV